MKNHIKKVALLCLLFVLAVFVPIVLAPNQGVEAQVFARAAVGLEGSGTEESPYKIKSKEDVKKLSQMVGDGDSFSGVYFQLTNDIDMSDDNFEPIGNRQKPFSGIFDGCGFIISNLQISTSRNTLGFFGFTNNATIQNLGLEDVKIISNNSDFAEREIYVGGMIAFAKSTEISNSYIKNQTDNKFDITSPYGIFAGAMVGASSSMEVINCYADVDLDIKSSTNSHDVTAFIGGIVGNMVESKIWTSYSSSNISVCHPLSNNADLRWNIGGLAGFVEGYYSQLVNSFYVGEMTISRPTDSVYCFGGIVGCVTNGALTPKQGAINFCHYFSNNVFNVGLPAVGDVGGYSMSGIVLQSKNNLTFFQRQTNYIDSNYFDLNNYQFDFDSVWLIESDYPVLQSFAYYTIEVEQSLNCSIEIVGEQVVAGNSCRVKAGSYVTLRATIDEAVNKFYKIKYWRHNSSNIDQTADLMEYSFVCSYVTQGKYSVVLQENRFSLRINVPTEFRDIGYVKYNGSSKQVKELRNDILYNYDVSVEVVLYTTDEAQNYAFDGWYVSEDANTKLDWPSQILNFKIGQTVPFDDDLNIYITPKFTRDMCRLTIDFNTDCGELKLFASDEFSSDEIKNKKIKMGQTLNIEAQPKEGCEFLGWFENEESKIPITKSYVLKDYKISKDTQYLYAKFNKIGEEEAGRKKLSGWAIFGIVAGCLAVVGIVVLIVVLVKKKGSYKSSWNF